MRILVTGREGQLVRSLAERGAGRPELEIVVLGRPELDLERIESIVPAIARVAPDAVVNAAAYTAVDQAEDESELAMRINGEAAGALARAAAARRVPFVQISTDYVFDGASAGPHREDAPTGPAGVYGRSKLLGEELVRAAAPDSHMIVRTAWVYSPFGHNFVKTMLRFAADREEVAVVADQIGNPTSALDLADALLHALENWRGGGSTGLGATYHLAGSGSCSWHEFAAEVFRLSSACGLPSARTRPIGSGDFPTRARRPADSRLDTSRFQDAFGFAMPGWRDSLLSVVERIARERTA